jgi:hypothetical protein
MGHARLKTLLGNTSGSSGTSPFVFVGDARLLTVSVQTSSGSASNWTISLSNSDGLQDPTFHWSVVTVLPNTGIFTIDPGARWLKAERANIQMTSTASNSTVILSRYYE